MEHRYPLTGSSLLDLVREGFARDDAAGVDVSEPLPNLVEQVESIDDLIERDAVGELLDRLDGLLLGRMCRHELPSSRSDELHDLPPFVGGQARIFCEGA